MKPRNKMRISLWQWPNVLALDAVLIGILWQQAIANISDNSLTLAARFVLGTSIWLTYTADRLFDTLGRDRTQLLSARHNFTKDHRAPLLLVWLITLPTNIGVAVYQLNTSQLTNGFYLLIGCLFYTALAQIASKHFFPKELCVALIFTISTTIFLESLPPIHTLINFGSSCLINCLIISHREKQIDSAMQVRSLSAELKTNQLLIALTALNLTITVVALSTFNLFCTLTAMVYYSLQQIGNRIQIEHFRVYADTTLVITGFALIASNYNS